MSHNDYKLLNWPYKIQNDIANNQIAFGALAKYRLYRRQGFEVRWVDGGKELARKNLILLIVRGRFGGKIVDGNAFAVMEDAQA